LLKCQQVLTDLSISYQADFEKYRARLSPDLLKSTLMSVARQGQGKFVYTQVGADLRSTAVKSALEMLTMAGLIYSVVHTDCNGLPLYAEADERYRRYIFMDTGLLQRTLGLDLGDVLLSDDFKAVNRGALAETFVGTEIVKHRSPYSRDMLYCWHRDSRNSNAEVDYVVSHEGQITPVEVKSGTRGSMQSMRLFMEAKHIGRGIRTSLENFGEIADISIYPLYAIGAACR
jgi:hypothetical protein